MSNLLVYVLVDPVTEHIRYVGASSRGTDRPKEHLGRIPKRDKTRRANWLRSLNSKGLKPVIKIVDYYSDATTLGDEELKWISYFKSVGCPLTNHQEAGSGKFSVDTETRAKISKSLTGIKRSAETVALMSKIRAGSTVGRPGWFKPGHRPSEETKTKISKALTGRVNGPHSEETRNRISEANKGQTPWTKGRCGNCKNLGHKKKHCPSKPE